MKISKNSLKYIYIYICIYICIYILYIYIYIYILHILYIYYICLIFWLGRDGLWTRNLEISFKVSSEILFCWGLHCVKAGLLFIIFYVLFIYLFVCFIYLFIYIVLFLIFLVSTWSELLLRGVSIYILVFVNLFIHLLIYLGAPWWSSFLVQLHVDGMQFYQQ